MAAFAISAYKVNNSTDKALHQKAHTSLWSLLRGAPRTSGKGLKAAYVKIAHNTDGVYATGGLAVDLLGNLPGWTEILTVIGTPVYNSTATAAWELPIAINPNDATAGNRKIVFVGVTPQAETDAHEIANGRALAGGAFEMLVLGY